MVAQGGRCSAVGAWKACLGLRQGMHMCLAPHYKALLCLAGMSKAVAGLAFVSAPAPQPFHSSGLATFRA